jgi:type III secretory pathway lipoprotein EscJ
VHLATPKQSVFVRDRTPPKASVVLAPYPGRAVSASQVQAIVHLVSSSVPYLAPDHVTVVGWPEVVPETVAAKVAVPPATTEVEAGETLTVKVKLSSPTYPAAG